MYKPELAAIDALISPLLEPLTPVYHERERRSSHGVKATTTHADTVLLQLRASDRTYTLNLTRDDALVRGLRGVIRTVSVHDGLHQADRESCHYTVCLSENDSICVRNMRVGAAQMRSLPPLPSCFELGSGACSHRLWAHLHTPSCLRLPTALSNRRPHLLAELPRMLLYLLTL